MELAARRAIRVLDADLELAHALDDTTREVARRHVVALVEDLPAGVWEPGASCAGARNGLGLLVIDGLLTRDVRLPGAAAAELLGAGDLLRPWDYDEISAAPIPTESELNVIEPVRVAILDARATAAMSRWPALTTALAARSVRRARWLTLLLAISHLTRVETRLLALFWHLADRWGRVTPDGVVVPVRLTHELVGRIVGAQRPSVTTALGELSRSGRLLRRADGTWLLDGDSPELLAAATAKEPARAAQLAVG